MHLERRDVDDLLARVGSEHAQHGQLGADGLARPSGCAQQHALIRVVQCVERLRPSQTPLNSAHYINNLGSSFSLAFT